MLQKKKTRLNKNLNLSGNKRNASADENNHWQMRFFYEKRHFEKILFFEYYKLT